ncbi:MAG: VOC family protein [Phycisphaerae bacterium]
MSNDHQQEIGAVTWVDLTVPDAERIKEFYSQVIGWHPEPVSVGDYEDYGMVPPAATTEVAGICHARGINERLPPQWLIYITVEDVGRSARRCVELGGSIVDGPRKLGAQQCCVLRDPAGAVAAIVGP